MKYGMSYNCWVAVDGLYDWVGYLDDDAETSVAAVSDDLQKLIDYTLSQDDDIKLVAEHPFIGCGTDTCGEVLAVFVDQDNDPRAVIFNDPSLPVVV